MSPRVRRAVAGTVPRRDAPHGRGSAQGATRSTVPAPEALGKPVFRPPMRPSSRRRGPCSRAPALCGSRCTPGRPSAGAGWFHDSPLGQYSSVRHRSTPVLSSTRQNDRRVASSGETHETRLLCAPSLRGALGAAFPRDVSSRRTTGCPLCLIRVFHDEKDSMNKPQKIPKSRVPAQTDVARRRAAGTLPTPAPAGPGVKREDHRSSCLWS